MKFKEANQICSPLKIGQSTLNKTHVIEITKACTVAFMKTRNWFFDVDFERNVSIGKKNRRW